MTLVGYKGFGPQTLEEDFRQSEYDPDSVYQPPTDAEYQRRLYSPGVECGLLRQIAQMDPLIDKRRVRGVQVTSSSPRAVLIDVS
jgi:hypothetical protein